MRQYARPAFIGWCGVVASSVGCSVLNLDAVTSKPTGSGGVAGAAIGGASNASGGTAATSSTASAGSSGAPSTGGSAATASCAASALSPGDTNETVQVGSVTRSYYLHVPSTYDGTAPVPLIVDFHFLGNSGEREQRVSPFPAATHSEGVILAYPDGQVGPAGAAWNMGSCCVDRDTDDIAFAKALVDQLRTKACIDAKRVYAVGYEIGGGMAHYLGCHAADVFAAIVSAGFDLLEENSLGCTPNRPITVISFRELSDRSVPYSGGSWTTVPGMPITLLGAQATFSRWAELNQCTGSASAEDSNGCTTYQTCAGGVEVVLCTKEAGVPVPDNGSIAWPILQRHPMP